MALSLPALQRGGRAMPRKRHDADSLISDLEDALMDLFEDTSVVFQDKSGGLYEFDSDHLSLTLHVENERLKIRWIDVHKNTGMGTSVIEALHECADDHGFDVCAIKVQDNVEGFWLKMGYTESSEEGVFTRE